MALLNPQVSGTRTHLAMPLLHEGEPIGVISLRRSEVRSFTDERWFSATRTPSLWQPDLWGGSDLVEPGWAYQEQRDGASGQQHGGHAA